MNSLNSVLIEGTVARDPSMAYTPKGTAVTSFSVASDRYYRSGDQMVHDTSFIDVEVWAKLAQRCAEELSKGRNVRIVGRLQQDRWTDTEGHPRSRHKIVAEHVEFRPTPHPSDAEVLETETAVETDTPEEAPQT